MVPDPINSESINVEMVVTDKVKKDAAGCATQGEDKTENKVKPDES